ncbi:uncharacterized protein BDV14DRAFT_204739 [Aspergillus stella-maris]|uniref:uncharacterized protein n=1 Tax=Aspergillus stella-maris TaxID=1810926 RepID=UPI003CCC994C
MLGLLDLPNELLLSIAEDLDYTWDISSLCLVNKELRTVSQQCLHKFRHQYPVTAALEWATERGKQAHLQDFIDLAISSQYLDENAWNKAVSMAAKKGCLNDLSKDSPCKTQNLLRSALELLNHGLAFNGCSDPDPIRIARDHLDYLVSAARGGPAMLEFLFSKGFIIPASFAEYQNHYPSPIDAAFKKSDLASIKLLLDHGLPIPEGDHQSGYTLSTMFNKYPLDTALTLLDTLLARGANINAWSSDYGNHGASRTRAP